MSKYDDFDYHVGGAQANGQPEDNAFTHIGFMLSWLIRHDLGLTRLFGPDVIRQVKDGSLRPNDLRDFVDGQLLGQTLKREAGAFLDAYYMSAGYSADYDAEFGDLPEYGVPDDPEHQVRIDRRIDDSYGRWVAAGRPKMGTPAGLWAAPRLNAAETGDPWTELAQKWLDSGQPFPKDSDELRSNPDLMAQMAALDMKDLNITFQYSGPSELLESIRLPEGIKVVRVEPPKSHVDPDLESLVADAVGVPMNIDSLPANKWGAATLNRAIRNLGLKGKDVLLVTGMGKVKADPTVQVYRAPGVDRDRLLVEFQRYQENMLRGKWADGPVGDVPARWSRAKPNLPHNLVWFAIDEYVVYIASPAERSEVELMAGRLLAALRR
jgi:hypothetical protein